jgi:hypothetical protein
LLLVLSLSYLQTQVLGLFPRTQLVSVMIVAVMCDTSFSIFLGRK